jgi:hypothetical protein
MNVAALLQDSPSEERNSKRNTNNNWTQQQTQQSPASQARLNPSTASSSDLFHPRAHRQLSSAGPTTPTTSLHASPAMASLRPIHDRPPTSSTGSTHSTANFPGTTTSAVSGAGSPSASSVTAWAPPQSGSSSSFMPQSASVHNIDRAQDREKRMAVVAPATTQTLVGPGTQGFASGEFFFIFIKFPRFFFLWLAVKKKKILTLLPCIRRQIIPFYSYTYATFAKFDYWWLKCLTCSTTRFI